MSGTSVAGIARRGNLVLVMHRLPGGSVGGLWEFPGGKCEPGESPEEALKREWLEETALKITVGSQLAQSSFLHKGRTVNLKAFEVILPPDAEPSLIEHDGYQWVEPETLEGLELVDSDRDLLDQLFN